MITAILWTWATTVIFALLVMSASNFFYGSKMVFKVLRPQGHDGPLEGAAVDFAKEEPYIFLGRRIYAVEVWLTSYPSAVSAAVFPAMVYQTILAWMAV